MASRGSKIALAGTSLFAVTTIALVHFQQQAEKNVWPALYVLFSHFLLPLVACT